MRRFRFPEIVLGWFLGILTVLALAGPLSYQAAHCADGQPQHGQSGPRAEHIQAPALQEHSDKGHGKVGHGGKGQPIACGLVGFVPAVIGFMDSHEGFFVGGFTGALVVATILLWRATNALWEAGERQIAHFERTAERQAADMEASISAAEKANEIARSTLVASKRAWINIESVDALPENKISGEGGNIAVDILVRNVGGSPAINVLIDTMHIYDMDAQSISIAARQFRGMLQRQTEHMGTDVLFPNEPFEMGMAIVVGRDELAGACVAREDNKRILGIILLVGVAYKIASDPEAHFTIKPFGLGAFDLDAPASNPSQRPLRPVPFVMAMAD